MNANKIAFLIVVTAFITACHLAHVSPLAVLDNAARTVIHLIH